MQEENIFKMAELADTEIKDVPTINILLCYLLYKINRPIETEQLYEIAIGTETINYFYYQDSIDYLTRNSLISMINEDGKKFFKLETKGYECARRLKGYAPKSYRDRLVLAAMRYFARIKAEHEVQIEYIPVENGCYARIRCLDKDCDLMDLRLYAPDITQAKLIGEKIMLNPAGFYGKIVDIALSNKESPYDLSDN